MGEIEKFEAQKTEILKEIEFHVEAKIVDQIKQLQPPRPTCSTCAYWIDEELKVTKDSVFPHKTCDNLKMWDNLKISSDKKAKLVFINPTKDFGCAFHSDYEVENDNS
jgi:hypothetical protein